MDWAMNSYVFIFLASVTHILLYIRDDHLATEHYSGFDGIPAVLLLHIAAVLVLQFF